MPRTKTRKTTTNKTRARAGTNRATVVDLRHPLPVRRRNFTGPCTPAQITEARAVLASAMARLPVPSLLWLTQPDGRAYAQLANGTLLIHTHETAPEFDAHIPCQYGARHQYHITGPRELAEARVATYACTGHRTTPNTDADWDAAIARGIAPTTTPNTGVVVQLRAGVRRAQALHDDTQPLSRDDIDAGLTADQPKERPQP